MLLRGTHFDAEPSPDHLLQTVENVLKLHLVTKMIILSNLICLIMLVMIIVTHDSSKSSYLIYNIFLIMLVIVIMMTHNCSESGKLVADFFL